MTYRSKTNSEGMAHGLGTYYYDTGCIYTGEWKDGAQNGQGTSTLANGTTYTGEYKDGEPVP